MACSQRRLLPALCSKVRLLLPLHKNMLLIWVIKALNIPQKRVMKQVITLQTHKKKLLRMLRSLKGLLNRITLTMFIIWVLPFLPTLKAFLVVIITSMPFQINIFAVSFGKFARAHLLKAPLPHSAPLRFLM